MKRAFVFASVKGGVGKTTLAMTAAAAFAEASSTAFVDADFSGTSIADALPQLRAPDGGGGWRTEAETLELRRHAASRAPWLDAWVFGRPPPGAPAAWMHPEHAAIAWYPSSPHPIDVTRGLPRIRLEISFDRLTSAIGAIANALGADGRLIVDLPPTLAGIASVVVDSLLGNHLAVMPILVTTDDRNDVYRSVREFRDLRIRYPESRWILNRSHRPPQQVREDLRAFLGDELPGIENHLRAIPRSPELEGVFTRDRLVLGDAPRRVMQLLGEGE